MLLPLMDVGAVSPNSARIDDAVALAPLEVQIEPVDSQSIGGGQRPVDIAHDRRASGRAQVTGVPQPGIEIELPAEIGEAVVAHHEDGGPAAIPVRDVADHL